LERALVTGASGFIGRRLASKLGGGGNAIALGAPDWRESIGRADFRDATVFHLAARVPGGVATEAQFQHDNVEKTRALAQHAATQGARRLVFLSTIKVNGEQTHGRAFRFDDAPAPEGAYARSKWTAERALAEIAAATGLAIVVVRAPLVYGAQARGSLRSLARLADSPLPLPFSALDNRRSFIHVDDLVQVLIAAAAMPEARGATLLVAHRERLSTARLVTAMRQRLARPPRLFGVAARDLERAAALLGQSERMHSLTRSLEVDATHAETLLAWRADVGPEAAIGDLIAGARAG
jgi:nucleoside-diphosphate-sugar epimerase